MKKLFRNDVKFVTLIHTLKNNARTKLSMRSREYFSCVIRLIAGKVFSRRGGEEGGEKEERRKEKKRKEEQKKKKKKKEEKRRKRRKKKNILLRTYIFTEYGLHFHSVMDFPFLRSGK